MGMNSPGRNGNSIKKGTEGSVILQSSNVGKSRGKINGQLDAEGFEL